ncbi:MAG: hypothetical protein ACFFD4_39720 [Candidatus Odinarchaeota archaeon]
MKRKEVGNLTRDPSKFLSSSGDTIHTIQTLLSSPFYNIDVLPAVLLDLACIAAAESIFEPVDSVFPC